jgi:hypothetical protein
MKAHLFRTDGNPYDPKDLTGTQCLAVHGPPSATSLGMVYHASNQRNYFEWQKGDECSISHAGTRVNDGGSRISLSTGTAHALPGQAATSFSFAAATGIPGTPAAALMSAGTFFGTPTVAAAAMPPSAAAFGIAAPGAPPSAGATAL